MNMHADENSDGVIVPEKRPNKEGLRSAEAVEGRTPPKGNGGETAAVRTLRRDTASNGLIAERRAARQSKSVRFNWEKFIRLVARFFPPIRTIHPLPCHRFDARTQGRNPVR